MLNRLNWAQLGEALAIRPATSTSEGIDLRVADAFDLARLADTLQIDRHDLENSFCTANRSDALLDAASPSLRFCQICASAGFHATLFQFTAFRCCPIHGCPLRDTCTACGQPLPYRLQTGFVRRPYACHCCGLCLLAAMSLRRLHAKTGIDVAGLDRLRAWHHYFFRYAQLLSPGRRDRRDAAGQYLPSDEIQSHSSIPRRLAFIGELQQVLSLPPLMPRVYPVADATLRGTGGPRASAFRSSRCAWAARWPHVDRICIMLDAAYRRIRRSRSRRLARSIGLVRPGVASAHHLPDRRLLLFDGTAPVLSIALLGWRLSWEQRFSIQTLMRCQAEYPPFGLLEWLAFMPAHLPPPRARDREDWLLRHFVHALDETWRAWRAIASGMQEGGYYVVSPLIFPTRLLWMDFAGGTAP
ncbi:hypothetical protein [Paraburkholderia tropica]|uniref:hypothetical protein n=1 Tax=Paraburkholderia tropica TaxID=92647 RepID=UPI001E3E4D1D|nr:hypothetical protein [Paraburkholderia tropica]